MAPEPRSLGTSSVISRRRFIRTVGAVAATAALTPVVVRAQAPTPEKPAAPVPGQKGRAHGMLIVDAQIHLWKNGKPAPNHRQVADFTADDALKEMDEAGVDAAVIHPPRGWDPNANELAVEAARQHPNRFAVLGNFPLDRPESQTLIDGWKSRPGMLGLRFALLQPHQQTWLTDGTMDWLWPAAERAGLPVALLGANFLQVVGPIAEIAERHPGLKLIIDHFGRPDAAWTHLPALVATAKFPNVALKATGAPSYSTESYPYRDIHGHIRKLYDAFGPERMFWGTDITRMPISWRQCVTIFTEELPWLSAKDKELIMGQALCAWLGWNLPG
jgi:predicted TIM-barrel fold metal-dependent hydrolase